jgi:hypothetical protein
MLLCKQHHRCWGSEFHQRQHASHSLRDSMAPLLAWPFKMLGYGGNFKNPGTSWVDWSGGVGCSRKLLKSQLVLCWHWNLGNVTYFSTHCVLSQCHFIFYTAVKNERPEGLFHLSIRSSSLFPKPNTKFSLQDYRGYKAIVLSHQEFKRSETMGTMPPLFRCCSWPFLPPPQVLASLEQLVLKPQPPECSGYRPALPHLAHSFLF